jgi:hypothetical protein
VIIWLVPFTRRNEMRFLRTELDDHIVRTVGVGQVVGRVLSDL